MHIRCLFIIKTCILSSILFFYSCTHKEKRNIITPWGEVQTDTIDENFSASDIINNGELIVLTMSGPETYYDYRGHGLGTQYLLCEKFAQKIGVSVRVELCKDTTEMIKRLTDGEGDLIAFMLPKNIKHSSELLFCGAKIDSTKAQWAVAPYNKELAAMLDNWFSPNLFNEIRKEERMMFSVKSVKRHTYAPFLNKSAGIISSYDAFFKKHAPTARWDWRLIAAQCYQESCFDPKAQSWAGACGLMQIMPSTAEHIGLPVSQIYDPEKNIAAATRFIAELMNTFHDIPNIAERQLFVLAAYNAGPLHIRDAMALARKNGHNPHRWGEVARYVLALQSPVFYKDPVVKYGYMRGSETVDYVERIRQRYAQYKGIPYKATQIDKNNIEESTDPFQYNIMSPRRAKKKHRFKI